MSNLIAELRRAPHTFNLFQAISLIERGAPDRAPVGTSVGMDEALRLAGHVDMAFAPSDIASLVDSARPGPALTLRTAALTLAGGQGPIAAPFTELLMDQRCQRNHAGLDFLDIFNQRLLGFWYRARCKHHLALQPGGRSPVPKAGQPPMAPLLRTIDLMSGLGRSEGARGPAGELAWLRHAALQSAAPRSMTSLLALLYDRTGVRFSGRQFVGAWHAVAPSDRARLQGNRSRPRGLRARPMGVSLGARAWDQAAGVALTAPPLAPATFAALLPGGAQFALLGWLVARHLQADFNVTLELTMASPPSTRLGRTATLPPRLGRCAWLCSRNSAAHMYQRARLVLSAPHSNAPEGT